MKCTLADVFKGEPYRVEVSEATEMRFRSLKNRFRKINPGTTTGQMLRQAAQKLKFGQDLTEDHILAYLEFHNEPQLQETDPSSS